MNAAHWHLVLNHIPLLAGGGLIAWTANLGGKIHHQEIRNETSAVKLPQGEFNEDN